MTTRVLPRDEWPRLDGTLLEATWPHLPDEARVVVVEDADGQIIGCSALFPVWHQEGTWVEPFHRGRVSVNRALLKAMREQLHAVQAREVWMMARTPATAALCQKFGPSVSLSCEHFAVTIGA